MNTCEQLGFPTRIPRRPMKTLHFQHACPKLFWKISFLAHMSQVPKTNCMCLFFFSRFRFCLSWGLWAWQQPFWASTADSNNVTSEAWLGQWGPISCNILRFWRAGGHIWKISRCHGKSDSAPPVLCGGPPGLPRSRQCICRCRRGCRRGCKSTKYGRP